MDAVLSVRGRLGFNVIALMEMGEERGSPGLREFCVEHAQDLKADLFIASDGPRIAPETPTMFMGSRGVCNFVMRLDVHNGAHHSGNWGGLLTNPGVVMAHAIATMIDPNGKFLSRVGETPQCHNPSNRQLQSLKLAGVKMRRK
jgi:acetylornithine deacetylase/succinyl-diaminopimelate desuccinylase-like protein